MGARVFACNEMSKVRGTEASGLASVAGTTQGKISGFLRIYNKLLQKLKGEKYDKITASICARFNRRCMYIIKSHNTPQLYLDAIRTRLLPDYHASNCEVARDCGKYPFTETFKEILILYAKMEMKANTPDRIVRTLMGILYEIAEFDRNVEDVRWMATVATIQILLGIEGYQHIKNDLLKKLAVKLGSPVLSEIFASCEGKNEYECRKAIPMDHPDIQKIRKAVEVFNGWFSSFFDIEEEEDDNFECMPSFQETCKAETLASLKEELISVKDERPNEVPTTDLTGDTPRVTVTWEVRTDMRKKCNQRGYGFLSPATSFPVRKITPKSKASTVLCIDDDDEIVNVKKRKEFYSPTSSPVKSHNKPAAKRNKISAPDDEVIIVSVDSESTKQNTDPEIEIVDTFVPKKMERRWPVFDELEIIDLDEEDDQVEIVEEATSQLQIEETSRQLHTVEKPSSQLEAVEEARSQLQTVEGTSSQSDIVEETRSQLQIVEETPSQPQAGSQLVTVEETRSQLPTVEETKIQLQTIKETENQLQTVMETTSELQTVEETGSQLQIVKETTSQLQTVEETPSQIPTVEETGSQLQIVKETTSQLQTVEEAGSQLQIEETSRQLHTEEKASSQLEAVEETRSQLQTVEETPSQIPTVEETKIQLQTIKETESQLQTVEEAGSQLQIVNETTSQLQAVEETPSQLPTVEETKIQSQTIKETESQLPTVEETEIQLQTIKETERQLQTVEETPSQIPTVEETKILQTLKETESQLPTVEETEIQLQTIKETERQLQTVEEAPSQLPTVEETKLQLQTIKETESQVQTVKETRSQLQTVEEAGSQLQIEETSRQLHTEEKALSQLEAVEETRSQLQTVNEAGSQLQTVEQTEIQLQTKETEDQLQTVNETGSQLQIVEEAGSQLQIVKETTRQLQTVEETPSQLPTVEETKIHLQTIEETESQLKETTSQSQTVEEIGGQLQVVKETTSQSLTAEETGNISNHIKSLEVISISDESIINSLNDNVQANISEVVLPESNKEIDLEVSATIEGSSLASSVCNENETEKDTAGLFEQQSSVVMEVETENLTVESVYSETQKTEEVADLYQNVNEVSEANKISSVETESTEEITEMDVQRNSQELPNCEVSKATTDAEERKEVTEDVLLEENVDKNKVDPLDEISEISNVIETPASEAKNVEETTSEVNVPKYLQKVLDPPTEENEVLEATAETENAKDVTDAVPLEEVQESSEELFDIPEEISEVSSTIEISADGFEIMSEVEVAGNNEITTEIAAIKETADKFEQRNEQPRETESLSTCIDGASKTDQISSEVEINAPSAFTEATEMPHESNVKINDEENKTANECPIEELVPQEQTAVTVPENENEEILEIHTTSIEETLESNLADETTEPDSIETEDNSSQEVYLKYQTEQRSGEESTLAIETEEGDSQASASTVSSSDQTLSELKLSLLKQKNLMSEKTTENSSKSDTHKEKGRQSSIEKRKSKSSSKDRELDRSKDRRDSFKKDKYSPKRQRESTSAWHKSRETESRRSHLEDSDPNRRKRKASQDCRHFDESSSRKREKIEVPRDRKDSKGYNDKSKRSDSRSSRESDSKRGKDKKGEESKLLVKVAVTRKSTSVLDEFEDFLKCSSNKTSEAKKSDSDDIYSDISDGSLDLLSDDEHEKRSTPEKEKTNYKGNDGGSRTKGYQHFSPRRAKSYDVTNHERFSPKSKRSSTVDRSVDVKNKPKTKRDDRREDERSGNRNKTKNIDPKSHSRYSSPPSSRRKFVEKSSEPAHKKGTVEKIKKETAQEITPYISRLRESTRKSTEKSTSGTSLRLKLEKEVGKTQHNEPSAEHPKTVVIPEICVTAVDETTSKENEEMEVVTEPVKPQPRRSRRLSAMYGSSPKYDEHAKVHETVDKPNVKDEFFQLASPTEVKVDQTLSIETTEDLHGKLEEETSDSLQVLQEVEHITTNQEQSVEVGEEAKAPTDMPKESPEKSGVVLEIVQATDANIPQENEVVQNVCSPVLEPLIQSTAFSEENTIHVITPTDEGIEGSVTMPPLEVTVNTSEVEISGLKMLANTATLVSESMVQPSSLMNQDISQAFTRNHIHQEEQFLSINRKTKHVDSNSSDDSDFGLTIDTLGQDDGNSRSPHLSMHVDEKPLPCKTTDHSIMTILTKDATKRSPEQVQKKKQASLYLRQKQLAADLCQKLPGESQTECLPSTSSSTVDPFKVRTKAERKEAQLFPVSVNTGDLLTVSPRSNKRKGTSPSKRPQLQTLYDDPVPSVSTVPDENIAEIPNKRLRFSTERSIPKTRKGVPKNGNKDILFKRDNVNKLVEAINACRKTNEGPLSRKGSENGKAAAEESVKTTTGLDSPLKEKNKSKKVKKQSKVVVPPTPPPLPPPPPQPTELDVITSRMPPKKRETRKSFEGIALIPEHHEIQIIPIAPAVEEVKNSTKTPAPKTRTKSAKKPTQQFCRRSPRHAHMYGSYEEVENNFEVMSEPEEAKAKVDNCTAPKRRRRKSKSKAVTEAETSQYGSSPSKSVQERVVDELEIFPLKTPKTKRKSSESFTLTPQQMEAVEDFLENSKTFYDGLVVNDLPKGKKVEMSGNESSSDSKMKEESLSMSLNSSAEEEIAKVCSDKHLDVTIAKVGMVTDKEGYADKNEPAIIIEKVCRQNKAKTRKEKKNKKRVVSKRIGNKEPAVIVERIEDYTDKGPAVVVERIEEFIQKEPADRIQECADQQVVVKGIKQEPVAVDRTEEYTHKETFVFVGKIKEYTVAEPAVVVEGAEKYVSKDPAVTENHTVKEPTVTVSSSTEKEFGVFESNEPRVTVEIIDMSEEEMKKMLVDGTTLNVNEEVAPNVEMVEIQKDKEPAVTGLYSDQDVTVMTVEEAGEHEADTPSADAVVETKMSVEEEKHVEAPVELTVISEEGKHKEQTVVKETDKPSVVAVVEEEKQVEGAAVIAETVELCSDKELAVMTEDGKHKEQTAENETVKPTADAIVEAEMSVEEAKQVEGSAVIAGTVETVEKDTDKPPADTVVEAVKKEKVAEGPAAIVERIEVDEVEMHENDHLNAATETIPEVKKETHLNKDTIKEVVDTSTEVISSDNAVHSVEDSGKFGDKACGNKSATEIEISTTPLFDKVEVAEVSDNKKVSAGLEVLTITDSESAKADKITANFDSLPFVEADAQEKIKENSSTEVTAPITTPKSLPEGVSLTVGSIAPSTISDLNVFITEPGVTSIQDLDTSICSISLSTAAVTTVTTCSTVMSSSHASSRFVPYDPNGSLDFDNDIFYGSLVLNDDEVQLAETIIQSATIEDNQLNHSLGPFMGDSEQKSKNSSNDDLTNLPAEESKVLSKIKTDTTEKRQADLENNSPTASNALFTESGGVLDAEKAPVASPPPELFLESNQVTCVTNHVPAVTSSAPLPPSESAGELYTANNQISCGTSQEPGSEPTFSLIIRDNVGQRFQLLNSKELENIFNQEPLVGESNLPIEYFETDMINTTASFLPIQPYINPNPEPVQYVELKKIFLKDYSNINQTIASEQHGSDQNVKLKYENNILCNDNNQTVVANEQQYSNESVNRNDGNNILYNDNNQTVAANELEGSDERLNQIYENDLLCNNINEIIIVTELQGTVENVNRNYENVILCNDSNHTIVANKLESSDESANQNCENDILCDNSNKIVIANEQQGSVENVNQNHENVISSNQTVVANKLQGSDESVNQNCENAILCDNSNQIVLANERKESDESVNRNYENDSNQTVVANELEAPDESLNKNDENDILCNNSNKIVTNELQDSVENVKRKLDDAIVCDTIQKRRRSSVEPTCIGDYLIKELMKVNEKAQRTVTTITTDPTSSKKGFKIVADNIKPPEPTDAPTSPAATQTDIEPPKLEKITEPIPNVNTVSETVAAEAPILKKYNESPSSERDTPPPQMKSPPPLKIPILEKKSPHTIVKILITPSCARETPLPQKKSPAAKKSPRTNTLPVDGYPKRQMGFTRPPTSGKKTIKQSPPVDEVTIKQSPPVDEVTITRLDSTGKECEVPDSASLKFDAFIRSEQERANQQQQEKIELRLDSDVSLRVNPKPVRTYEGLKRPLPQAIPSVIDTPSRNFELLKQAVDIKPVNVSATLKEEPVYKDSKIRAKAHFAPYPVPNQRAHYDIPITNRSPLQKVSTPQMETSVTVGQLPRPSNSVRSAGKSPIISPDLLSSPVDIKHVNVPATPKEERPLEPVTFVKDRKIRAQTKTNFVPYPVPNQRVRCDTPITNRSPLQKVSTPQMETSATVGQLPRPSDSVRSAGKSPIISPDLLRQKLPLQKHLQFSSTTGDTSWRKALVGFPNLYLSEEVEFSETSTDNSSRHDKT